MQSKGNTKVIYNHDGGLVRFELLTGTGNVLIRIANTGSQIPVAERHRIFERFYRADPARSGRVEGTGLGLSLAHEIIRAHHGELTLETCDDQLTRFIVTLPDMSCN